MKAGVLSAKFLNITIIGVIVLYYCYVCYKYTFSFNFLQILEDGHYFLMPVMFFILATCLLAVTVLKNQISFNIFDFVILSILAVCSLLFVLGIAQFSFHNEAFCNVIVFLCCYLLLRMLEWRLIGNILIPFLLVVFCIELYAGYRDLFYFAHEETFNLLIAGHLKNSGIYSIYLVIHLPILEYYLNHTVKQKSFRVGIFIFVFLLCVILLYVTQSRSAILALVVFAVTLLTKHKFIRLNRPVLLALVLLFMALILGALIFIKPASISGRLIVWKISLQHLPDYFLTGVGLGRFPKYYPAWQVNYFDNLPVKNISEMLSADEVFTAYNEPLQLFVELGIGGVIGIVLLLYVLIVKVRNTGDHLGIAFKYVLLMIFIAGLFSYPLHVNVILAIIAVTFAYIIPLVFKSINIGISASYYYIFIGIFLVVTLKSGFVYRDIARWKENQDNIFAIGTSRLKEYKNLYPQLKSNTQFLSDYGQFLYTIGDSLAIFVLNESKKQLYTVSTIQTLANAYEAAGDTRNAILNWKCLSNLIPYKFTYKEKLLDLYISYGDSTNARKVANLILAMPVKRNDEIVKNIQQKAIILLQQ